MKSLFDIQINGFSGIDFQQSTLNASDLHQAVDALARHETRRFFMAFITDSEKAIENKLQNVERIRASDRIIGDAVCGYHIEGPWLSPEPGYRGAHNPAYMSLPDLAVFNRFQKAAGGNIRLVTLAPELPGSAAFIQAVTATGVQVAIGHSNASESDIDTAINAGARFCTHIGNGVPVDLHRHANVVQRLLARDELTAFLIPDGIHLPPYVLKNFFRAKPYGKALFTTDCMAAAAAPPGSYRLGAETLAVSDDRIVRLPGGSLFAGSALTPPEAVRNASQWLGLPPSEARHLFSSAIAAAFGVALPSL